MNKRIKKLRKELDLTQQKFADRIGTTANVLTNYETGRRNPSNSVINNICKTFNVNEEWLRTGQGQMLIKTPDDTLEKLKHEYNLDDFSYGLICEYLKLNETKRDIVRQYFYNAFSYDEDFQSHTATREELHAELDRQLDLEEEAEERLGVSTKSS